MKYNNRNNDINHVDMIYKMQKTTYTVIVMEVKEK